MFLKKIKNLSIFFLLTYIIIPINAFAYSSKIIASGENIGINLKTKGILVVGTYEVNGNFPAASAGLKNGDIITSINNNKVSAIADLAEKINEADSDEITITYLRNSKNKTTHLKLYKDENSIYKTGLFVKDSVAGIGTLTFIDPVSKKFGALGHEIIEQSTGQILDIKDGKIYDSVVTGIIPSRDGNPGEKKAEYDFDDVKGIVYENTKSGIFGDYIDNINDSNVYEVALPEDIGEGKAQILTVLDDTSVKKYDINIIKITYNTFKIIYS